MTFYFFSKCVFVFLVDLRFKLVITWITRGDASPRLAEIFAKSDLMLRWRCAHLCGAASRMPYNELRISGTKRSQCGSYGKSFWSFQSFGTYRYNYTINTTVNCADDARRRRRASNSLSARDLRREQDARRAVLLPTTRGARVVCSISTATR